MEMTIKRYVYISERSKPEIWKEIKVSRQCLENWLTRDTPVFVEIDPKEFEKVIRVYRREILYSSATAKKRGPRFKRQVR